MRVFHLKPKDNSVVKVPFETKEINEQEELYGGLFANTLTIKLKNRRN